MTPRRKAIAIAIVVDNKITQIKQADLWGNCPLVHFVLPFGIFEANFARAASASGNRIAYVMRKQSC